MSSTNESRGIILNGLDETRPLKRKFEIEIKPSVLGYIFIIVLKEKIKLKKPFGQQQPQQIFEIFECVERVIKDDIFNYNIFKEYQNEVKHVTFNENACDVLSYLNGAHETNAPQPRNISELLKEVVDALQKMQKIPFNKSDSFQEIFVYTTFVSILCSKIDSLCKSGPEITSAAVEAFLFHIVHPLRISDSLEVFATRPSCSFGAPDIVFLMSLCKFGFHKLMLVILRVPRTALGKVVQPALEKFCDARQLDLESTLGIHTLVEIFAVLFSSSFAEKLLSHLKFFVEDGKEKFKNRQAEALTIIIYIFDMFRILTMLETFNCDEYIAALCESSLLITRVWYDTGSDAQKRILIDVFVGVFRYRPQICLQTFSRLQLEEMKIFQPKVIHSASNLLFAICQSQYALPILEAYEKDNYFLLNSNPLDSEFIQKNISRVVLFSADQTTSVEVSPFVLKNCYPEFYYYIMQQQKQQNQNHIQTNLESYCLKSIVSFIHGESISLKDYTPQQLFDIQTQAGKFELYELKRKCLNAFADSINENTIQEIAEIVNKMYSEKEKEKDKDIPLFLIATCQTLTFSKIKNLEFNFLWRNLK